MLQQKFSSPVAARLAGITLRQLSVWANDGFITPSLGVAKGTGTRNYWSFRDIVALRTAGELRKAGVSVQGLHKIAQRLKAYDESFASAFLIFDGSDVLLRKDPDLISLFKQPHQMLMFVVSMERIEEEVREAMAA